MTILKNFHHFSGSPHFSGTPWATGYAVNALAYQGAVAPHTGQPYSEALLMGVNGGLCAGYFAFEYEGHDPHLHFLTRYPFDEQPGAFFDRLGIPLQTQTTTDSEKAAANVINLLATGSPVVVWLDVMSLPYSAVEPTRDNYYLIMPVLIYGYDRAAGIVHLADRAGVPLTATVDEVAAARARISKTRHKIAAIGMPDADKLPSAVESGIRACITIFTDIPPVGGPKYKGSFGFDAYLKWVTLLTEKKDKRSWARQFAPGRRMIAGLTSTYRFIELYFTGGRGARHVYAAFLDEAAVILEKPALREVGDQFRRCAHRWDDLTGALLPDTVAPLADLRALMRHEVDLFLEQGNNSIDERRLIAGQIRSRINDLGVDFPLTDDHAAALRAEMAGCVMAIHDAEQIAIGMLADAVG
jgi:hypothetical protein